MAKGDSVAFERMPRRGYAKPVVVPDRLELLAGPVSGVVTLPRHLKWSGNPRYDLDEPGRIADMYRAVINEAATPTDLYTYLDQGTLVRLWPAHEDHRGDPQRDLRAPASRRRGPA